MMDMDQELPFDAVAVGPSSRPNLDDQLSAEPDGDWDTDKKWSLQNIKHFKTKAAAVLVLLATAFGIAYFKLLVPSNQNSNEDSHINRGSSLVEFRAEMESIVNEISDPFTLLDRLSAQSKALEWLVGTDTLPHDYDNFKQRYVLMVFFFSTNGNGWTILEGWDELVGTNECHFSGIDCDSDMNVISLSKYARRLSGTIPEELGALSRLEVLSIGRNDLQGSIPSSIFTGCQRLMHLDVGYNRLSSTISTEIGNLAELRVLLLPSTFLSGPLPESLKNLTKLNTVSLLRTDLEGRIFDFVVKWRNLQYLNIGQSLFSGSFPSEIGDLNLLRALLLDGTSVKLTLPTEIGKLTNLSHLRLDSFGTHGGSIPSEIGNLENLVHLYIYGSSFTGSIPSEVGKLSALKYMRISGGLTSGTLPTEIASLKTLETLDVTDNNLHGEVPAVIGDLKHLTELSIVGNNYEGRLPGTMCSIQTVHYDCTVTCDCCVCTCRGCEL